MTRRMTSLEVGKVEQGFPPGFRARGHRFFGGIVEMSGVPLWGKAFWRLFGGRPGDHRDWPAIEAWAGEIAAALPGVRAAGGPDRP
jgi:menaquinone-dependent protoporphyrinogen oxidase